MQHQKLSEFSQMKVCVAGPGALGATLAAMLAARGLNVSVIARNPSLSAIAAGGVWVQTADGSKGGPVAVSSGDNIDVQDVLLLCAKAQDLPALARTARGAIGPDTTILPVVNGIPWWYFHGQHSQFSGRVVHSVDPDGDLAVHLPPSQIIGSIAMFTADRLEPGRARALNPVRMIIGEIDNIDRPRSRAVAELLTQAGIATRLSECIRDPLWTKVIANLMSNPLSVVAQAPLCDIGGVGRLATITRRLIDEALLTAAAFGARCELSPEQLLQFAAGMGETKTSMLQDFEQGRPLELGSICEAVIELAEIHDIAMPLTRHIADIARYLSEGRAYCDAA